MRPPIIIFAELNVLQRVDIEHQVRVDGDVNRTMSASLIRY
jgi:hypothetical protein